jgi:hypothetical protein
MMQRNETATESTIITMPSDSTTIVLDENNTHTNDNAYEPVTVSQILSKSRRAKASTCRRPALSTLLMPAPTLFALTDAADIAMSIHRSGSNSAATAVIAGTIAFLSSIGLNFETTRESFAETISIIKSRKLPHAWPTASRAQLEEWPKISRRKNIAAIILAAAPTTVAIIGYTCSSIYVISPTPTDWQFWQGERKDYQRLWDLFVTTPTATGAAITCAFTAGSETFKLLRRLLARKKSRYYSSISKWLSLIIGGGLGACDSLQDAINVFASIIYVMGLKETNWVYLVSALATLHLFANFSFSGLYGVNSVDALYEHIATRQFRLKKTVAFTLALGMSGYLAYLKRSLNVSFYHEVRDDFFPTAVSQNTDLTQTPNATMEKLLDTFSWLIVSQDTLLGTASVYEPLLELLNNIVSVCKKRLSCCKKPYDVDSDDEDDTVLSDHDYPAADKEEEESLLTSAERNAYRFAIDLDDPFNESVAGRETAPTNRYADEDDTAIPLTERSDSFYQPNGFTLFNHTLQENSNRSTRASQHQRHRCQIL